MPLHILDVTTLEQIVLSKCDSFVNMGVWPSGNKIDYRKWLANFEPDEREYALYLLNSFCYYNKDVSIALLKASILKISNGFQNSGSIIEIQRSWAEFIDKTIFIPSTGERRNVTDSGLILASYLRRDLKIPEAQVMVVDDLYGDAYIGVFEKMENIIFFDDLIGSGNQFLTLFNADFEKDTDFLNPIGEQCSKLKLIPHFCVLIGTAYGIDRISSQCPDVFISYAHMLGDNHSPFHDDNLIFPDRLKPGFDNFIRNASKRAGIKEQDILGYHDLALLLAFEFTIPDSTLPLFSHYSTNWNPLMEKS